MSANLNPIDKAEVAVTDFSASLKHDQVDKELWAVLRGTADMRIWATLKTYLDHVHDEAVKARVTRVSVDFRTLEFMNSSCFKNFVAWLTKVHALPAEQRYKVRFLAGGQHHWQRRSLQALSCVAEEIISVETEP